MPVQYNYCKFHLYGENKNWGGKCISRSEYILTGKNTNNYNSWSGNGILLTRSPSSSFLPFSFYFHIFPFFSFFFIFFLLSPFYFLEVNTRDAAEDILPSSILWRNTWEGLNEIQAQPKHLLKEKKLDVTGSGSGSGSGFLKGRCLKKAFTAPVTPSSFSMAFASSTARSFTCNDS